MWNGAQGREVPGPALPPLCWATSSKSLHSSQSQFPKMHQLDELFSKILSSSSNALFVGNTQGMSSIVNTQIF